MRRNAVRKVLDLVPAVAGFEWHDQVHAFAAGGLDQRFDPERVEQISGPRRSRHDHRPRQSGIRIQIEDHRIGSLDVRNLRTPDVELKCIDLRQTDKCLRRIGDEVGVASTAVID